MKIAVINDLSGMGRCSLTASIPMLNILGHQVFPVPTAILSNQTGYPKFSFFDFTNYMDEYISNWKNYYNLKDINGMEKEYKKLKKQMDTILALDSTISEAKRIENIHNLLKNKGIDYELSEEEKQLINILK